MKKYLVQVEVEMHEGLSHNDIVEVEANSEDEATDKVASSQQILNEIAENWGGYDHVICVEPQLAWEE